MYNLFLPQEIEIGLIFTLQTAISQIWAKVPEVAYTVVPLLKDILAKGHLSNKARIIWQVLWIS